ncbi:ABC-2 type transport system permease protein [Catenuloplanes nepalensis]|uniref:ABC-2 type transport system permease protein n=1 Tax=Catenuloplanes nepalensis TaxID=587533 RepID=A0ABT9N6G2_9ACTN|nr:ABC transporter permease [Catenuloplanes nepalensis]MDP9799289.1 ABC-2 type transport system permease protein [Catenuloplanes nepalensis]
MLFNPTIAWMTARGLFGRRRFLLLFPLPLLLVALAVFARVSGINAGDWGPLVINGLGIAVLLPVTALIVGTGVLGSEIDDGTIVHILTKPLSRAEIVWAKFLVASGVTALTAAIPLYVGGVLVQDFRFGLALAGAAAIGSVIYSAVFLLLSLLSRRPVLVGLLYVLIWEGLLGNLVSGTRVLSIGQYTVTYADRFLPTEYLTANVSLPVTIVMSVIVTVLCLLYAVFRLRSFTASSETS